MQRKTRPRLASVERGQHGYFIRPTDTTTHIGRCPWCEADFKDKEAAERIMKVIFPPALPLEEDEPP